MSQKLPLNSRDRGNPGVSPETGCSYTVGSLLGQTQPLKFHLKTNGQSALLDSLPGSFARQAFVMTPTIKVYNLSFHEQTTTLFFPS